jgi:hypothetical protein
MKKLIVNKIVLMLIVMTIGLSTQAGWPSSFDDDVIDNSNGSGSGGGLPAIPLDGGLSLLLAAGAAYGVNRRIKK